MDRLFPLSECVSQGSPEKKEPIGDTYEEIYSEELAHSHEWIMDAERNSMICHLQDGNPEKAGV